MNQDTWRSSEGGDEMVDDGGPTIEVMIDVERIMSRIIPSES
jgi:hypothetical protein